MEYYSSIRKNEIIRVIEKERQGKILRLNVVRRKIKEKYKMISL